MTAPALSRLMDEQPTWEGWNSDHCHDPGCNDPDCRGCQPPCTVPWCVRDDPDTGTHGSRVGLAERTGVMLVAREGHQPILVAGVSAFDLACAAPLASLLARLGHAELAAQITSTAALAGGTS